jgi:hypothetical protein
LRVAPADLEIPSQKQTLAAILIQSLTWKKNNKSNRPFSYNHATESDTEHSSGLE